MNGMHRRQWAGVLSLVALLGPFDTEGAEPEDPGRLSVARLLGDEGRLRHERRLARLTFAGRRYSWSQYESWGRRIYWRGRVDRSPTTGRPSAPLSRHFVCAHCHNNRIEDAPLGVQDPVGRFEMVREKATDRSANLTGARPLFLAPGTTLFGAVHRTSFYNGCYSEYHRLPVPGGRSMNPHALEDAIQVCCRFCSVGRYAESWEIASLLAYLWSLEYRLGDLGFSDEEETAIARALTSSSCSELDRQEARSKILQRLVLRAGATRTPIPQHDGHATVGPYPDGSVFKGEADRGRGLYSAACAHCHGDRKPCSTAGADLAGDPEWYHRMLSLGTDGDGHAYMPLFPAERLSRLQIADIYAYLSELE